MPINFTPVSRARRFTFTIPDGVPFDREDSDRIVNELSALQPPPDEIQDPVASGLGDLVSDAFDVVYWDDKREDYEIMLDIEEAVRAGLLNRTWLVHHADGNRVSTGPNGRPR